MAASNTDQFGSRAIARNVVFSVITFALNMCISFFITPYITERFGSETYGYVKLANEFANYASLFSIALNSMASRFIMLERVGGNEARARKYFSSVGIANVIMAAVFHSFGIGGEYALQQRDVQHHARAVPHEQQEEQPLRHVPPANRD